MPITTRTWGRVHGSTTGMSPLTWNNPHLEAGSPFSGGSWTLLRTLCEWHLKVTVDAAASLPPDWWVFAEVRLGLKFSADGTAPGFAPNDLSPDVIAVQQLQPAVIAGALTVPSATSVIWTQKNALDIKTERRGFPNTFSAVYPFVWGTDTFGVLHGTGANFHVEGELELAALWGQ